MDTIKFSQKSIGSESLLVVLVSVFVLVTFVPAGIFAQENSQDKDKVVHQVAEKWLQVGMEQYKRGFYKAAEQSFLRAQDYDEHLTEPEREKLKGLIEQTHLAAIERERILEHIQTADALVKKNDLAKAKAHLENVKDSQYLTEKERELIAEGLAKLDKQIGPQQEAVGIYNRSVEAYEAGRLEEARKGFIEAAKAGYTSAPAGQKPEDYLVKIDSILAQRAAAATPAEAASVAMSEPSVEKTEVEPVAEKAQAEEVEKQAAQQSNGGYIEVINRKRNILRSYTRSVVNDAVGKAQDYISKGQYDKAKEAVEDAQRLVMKNELDLGEEQFAQYTNQLRGLSEQITTGQSTQAQQLQEQKRTEAIESQRQYREQTDEARQKRIKELMDSAAQLQKQQRYEEALGQLESVLATDPLNNEALLLKQTLEDTISFRKQLMIEKEMRKERALTLTNADETMIPWAEELVYPKNWREIAAKRKPEEAIGQDVADVAVFKQFDEVVDLSGLTSEMPFSEALEELKNSVDPPLKIAVIWRDLIDNADIDQTTPIKMDPISSIPLGKALELLLKSVSGGAADLGYIVEGGVITIATVEALPEKLETLVYDVTDLLGRPADYYAQSGQNVSVSGEGEVGAESFEQQNEMDRSEIEQRAMLRAESLRVLIQETVEPDKWYDAGGEGSIQIHESKKLIIRQTRDIHRRIAKLLVELRKALGYQVAIEARFLLVGENFLEDIGLDADFRINFGGNFGTWTFNQDSARSALQPDTGVAGSFSGIDETAVPTQPINKAMDVVGGFNTILDDLQVSFLLRATQAHRDAIALTAPRVSVLSGESATMRAQRIRRYPYQIEVDTEDIGEFGNFRFTVDYEEGTIITGTLMNITPTITHDMKNVLLNIVTEQREFLGFTQFGIQLPILGAGTGNVQSAGGVYTIPLPDNEISRVETRVSVPDGGTLMIGGQKVSVEVEREVGVPILSKIPVLGRLFMNRSKVRDDKHLIILVKPTIILQEEKEAEAVAAVENEF